MSRNKATNVIRDCFSIFFQSKVSGIEIYSCRQVAEDIETKGGVGAKPPARGGTPVPRPKPSDYRYIKDSE
jgi:hypothetical protein